MDARSDFDIFLDFVSFKALTIVNLIDEGEGCSGGRWEGKIWETNFLYKRPYGNLAKCIGSCEGVELIFLNGMTICSKYQQMYKCHLLNLIAQI